MALPKVQAPGPDANDTRGRAEDSRFRRYSALRSLWSVTNLRRQRYCSRRMSHGVESVGVKLTVQKDGTKRAGFSGVAVCGSVWTCPVCSAKVAAERSAELTAAMKAWRKRGGRLVFATFTVRHTKADSLETVWDSVAKGWEAVTSGRGWLKDQDDYGMPGVKTRAKVRTKGPGRGKIGPVRQWKEHVPGGWVPFVRALEVTQGDNGWHVHVHAVLFVGRHVTADKAAALGDSMFGRWLPAVTDLGLSAPSLRHGIDVRMILGDDFQALGDYFNKAVYRGDRGDGSASVEAVAGSFKTGRRGNRTPFQILADIVELGDADDLDTWHEWERVSKGRRQLTWAHGLRDFLNLAAERTDEQIAEEEAGGEKVLELDKDQFKLIVPHLADFKTAVERHAGVWEFLAVWRTMLRYRKTRGPAPDGNRPSQQLAA